MTLKLKSIALSLATASALALTMTEVRASDTKGDIQEAPQNSSILRTQTLQRKLLFAEDDGKEGASSLKNTRSKASSEKKKSEKPSNDFIGSDPRKKVKTNEIGNKKGGSGENDINDIEPALKIEEKQVEAAEQTHPEGKKEKKSRIPWLQLNFKEVSHKWVRGKKGAQAKFELRSIDKKIPLITNTNRAEGVSRKIRLAIKRLETEKAEDIIKSLVIETEETAADRTTLINQNKSLLVHINNLLPYLVNANFRANNKAWSSNQKLKDLLKIIQENGQDQENGQNNDFEKEENIDSLEGDLDQSREEDLDQSIADEIDSLKEALDQLRADNQKLRIENDELQSRMRAPQNVLFALNFQGVASNPQLQPINGQFSPNLLGMGINPQPQNHQLNFFNMLFHPNGSQIQSQPAAVQNQGSLSNAPLIKKEEETQP